MADKYLFKQVKIADPESPFNKKAVDILIDNGLIKRIGKNLRAQKVTIVDGKGFTAMPGFCDLYADFCDPGFEHREDITSGMNAAAAGGFTTVCVIPHTNPVVQSKSAIEYIIQRSRNKVVDVWPLGAVSEDLEGEKPTEMYDMHKAGAVGFTDAPSTIANSGLLLRALQYVQPFDGIVFDMSTDGSLSNGGEVNEGEVSVRMGLKGVPHMAEIVQLKRNIEILRYAGGRLHMYGVTTKEGVELIKRAKKEGLEISASVFVHHLLYTHEDVANYDSNLKSNPPFRTEADRTALLKGLKNGVIDCVVSQHTPLEIEEKKTEFEYAGYGMTGLETAYSIALKAFEDKVTPEEIVKWFSVQPRKILGLMPATINEGLSAEFSLVNARTKWEYNPQNKRSRSANSPLMHETMKGKVHGVFNHGKWLVND